MSIYSDWDNKLEEKSGKYCALRLGFRQVKGLREEDMNLLISQADKKIYQNIDALRDAGISQSALEKLADADAFNSMGLDRREALWEISTGNDRHVGLFAGQPLPDPSEENISLT